MTEPLQRVQVGERFAPHIKHWPDGVGQLRMTPEGAEFVLPISRPSAHEVKAFGRGNAEFAWVPADRYAVLLYKFTTPYDSNPKHGIQWSDAVWEYHGQAQEEEPGLPGERGDSFALVLILIDSDTGIVQALRMVSPPVEFADELRDGIARQAAVPADGRRAHAEVQALYATHSSSDLLLEATARFEALRD